MKKLYLAITGIALSISTMAQTPTPFWVENFENACASGCNLNGYTSPNGNWGTEVLNLEGTMANDFYVSCTEAGYSPGGCASACVGGAPPPGGVTLTGGSLHLGTGPLILGDVGARYFAGDAVLPGFDATTAKRATSPVINCQQKSNTTIVFTYIEFGDGLNDNASLWYFDGATWSLLADLPKTVCCNGACDGLNPGQWSSFSIPLPESSDNNPNVRIGFVWENNNDGLGTDPSFAVDNVYLFEDSPTSSNTITMFPSFLTAYCRGSLFDINYTVTGTFGPSNQFVAILSDATGDFLNSIPLGGIFSSTDGTISCLIPSSIAPGTGYRIRIVSSDPPLGSPDNGFDIEILNNPEVDVLASGPLEYCGSGSVDLFPSEAGDTYEWSTGSTDPIITVDQTGDYFVKVTFSDGCTSFSDTVTFTINPQPAAPVISGNQNFCPGGSVTLTSNVAPVVWNTTETTQSIDVSTIGNYSVVYTDANSCTSESAPFTVGQSTPPVNAVVIPGGPLDFCPGGSVTLNASVDDPTGVTFTWNTAAMGNSIVTTTAGDYSFTATNNDGCSTTSNTVTVSILACVPFTQLRSTDCGNMNFNLQSSIVADQVSGATQYEFEIRDAADVNVISSIIQTSRTLQLAGVTPALQWATQYNIRVRAIVGTDQGTFGNVCMIGTIADPNSNPIPGTQLNSTYCNANNLTLTGIIIANAVAGATQYEFEFSLGGNVVATKLQASNQLSIASVSPALNWGTTYSVRVRIHIGTAIGQFGTACNITFINDPASSPIPPTQLVSANCGRLNFSLSGACAAIQVPNATQYQFEFLQGGNVVGTRTSPNRNCVFSTVVPALQAGQQYDVRVRAGISGVFGPFGNVCTIGFVGPGNNSRTAAYNPEDDGISMEEFMEASKVENVFDAFVLPNPFNETAKLQLQGIESGQISMTDASGRLVWESNISGNSSFMLPVSLPNGLYLIRISDQETGMVKTIKTIKH